MGQASLGPLSFASAGMPSAWSGTVPGFRLQDSPQGLKTGGPLQARHLQTSEG
jgi:hypothetical protein